LARDAKRKSGRLPRWNQFRHGLTVAGKHDRFALSTSSSSWESRVKPGFGFVHIDLHAVILVHLLSLAKS